jgi:hypothetical protein
MSIWPVALLLIAMFALFVVLLVHGASGVIERWQEAEEADFIRSLN